MAGAARPNYRALIRRPGGSTRRIGRGFPGAGCATRGSGMRVWDQLIGRFDGPMTSRLVLQPLMSVALAVRAGLADARGRRSPYLWSLFADGENRGRRLAHGWRDVRRVFFIAYVMDAIYQVFVLKAFRFHRLFR